MNYYVIQRIVNCRKATLDIYFKHEFFTTTFDLHINKEILEIIS